MNIAENVKNKKSQIRANAMAERVKCILCHKSRKKKLADKT